MKHTLLWLIGLFALAAHCCADAAPIESSPQKAKNVILMIGDGMGFNAHVAGSYYRHGELGRQPVDSFPVRISSTTYMQRKKGVPIPEGQDGYPAGEFWQTIANGGNSLGETRTTDSAAASTAIHSGVKTLGGRIGMNGDEEPKPLELISQVAEKTGRKAGTLTTVPVSHATPAGFAAHNVSRSNYADIFTEMYERSPVCVIMGAGQPVAVKKKTDGQQTESLDYKYVGSQEIWEKILAGRDAGGQDAKGRDAKGRDAGNTTSKNTASKFVKIFPFPEQLPPFDGVIETSRTIEKLFNDKYKISEREAESRKANLDRGPVLSMNALLALNELKKRSESEGGNGFVLMIEGGAIDWANHSRDIERCVWEHTAFMKAVEAVHAWIEENGGWEETLLIVTADHETGTIWGPDTYADSNKNGIYDEGEQFNGFQPVKNNGQGKFPGVQYGNGNHSNALVPLWAKGAGCGRFMARIRGDDPRAAEFWNYSGKYVDNTDIFRVMESVLE